ncbi:MAG: hypothetical protein WAX69_21305, partial [Victivallales bacterium]
SPGFLSLTFPCQFTWQEREIGELRECPLASQSLPPAGQARRGANKYNFLYDEIRRPLNIENSTSIGVDFDLRA